MKSEIPEYKEREIKTISNNRKAFHDYTIITKFEAGIILQGTEVKSLRSGRCSLVDAYCVLRNQELYLINLHINEYNHGNRENHKPKRERKLLLHEYELNKLKIATAEKGMTIVPLELYFSGHIVKVEIATVKAKKKYDKREATKEREHKREINRKMKY
ncbi:MAG TPA: SsrA-binding protein SmpB [Candidatus Kapabacteria bacterium]|nr:SsrA-binding protein SmpB [Candidatus Kapabacteria bacterium]